MLDLVVQSIETVTDRIKCITLTRANKQALPGYSAGAHIEFQLDEPGPRAYSLIDFTTPPVPPEHYRIAVQREDDGQGGSVCMHQLQVGDTVSTTEPKNSFSLAEQDLQSTDVSRQPTLLLAGGIGITPLISMATTLRQQGVHFHLHYSGRSHDAMAFADTLAQQLAPDMTLYHDDIPSQRLDLNALLGTLPADQSLYVCGPKGMIEAAKSIAETAGIAAQQIHVELFESKQAAGTDNAFEVELQGSGEVFTIPPGKSIIDVLEAAGIDLVYDCQRGDCGICQTSVVAGEIDHRDVVLSEAERAGGKLMQICVSRAKSARLVLDI